MTPQTILERLTIKRKPVKQSIYRSIGVSGNKLFKTEFQRARENTKLRLLVRYVFK